MMAAVERRAHGERSLLKRLVTRDKLALSLASSSLCSAVVLGLLGEEATLATSVFASLGVASSLLGTRPLRLAERGFVSLAGFWIPKDKSGVVHGQREAAGVVGQREICLTMAEGRVGSVVEQQGLVTSHLFVKEFAFRYLEQKRVSTGARCRGCRAV
jgi:hypothetical protein